MALAMVRRHDEWRRLLILFERRVREGCAGVKPRTRSSYISAGPPIFSAAQDRPPPKHSAPQRITREPRDSGCQHAEHRNRGETYTEGPAWHFARLSLQRTPPHLL